MIVTAGQYNGTFVVGAVLGAAAGAAYGLWRAPRPGWKTRADLSNQAEALGDQLAARIEQVVATVLDFFGDSHAEPEVDLANPYRGLVVQPAPAAFPAPAPALATTTLSTEGAPA